MAKKKPIDLTDEELAKQEEEQNLNGIEKSIDSVILSNKSRIEELDDQISDYFVADHEDREGKISLMEERNALKNTVNRWEGFKDSPYFGRMDLFCNASETEVFFIGEKNISDGSNVYVLDWRTPMGGVFYNGKATEYKVEGNDYKLMLRRRVTIKKAKVTSVNTEYDKGALSLDGEVIDPFLLSVLRDKRRNYKLTDIIRTIQGNQNELIRKPLEESFIVQGCAGSGKTMILLHRLSYIAFNYPDVNFSRFCVLTPNELFNLHVDDLSRKLGLDRIKRYSVEGFYASWIRSLGKNDTVTTDNPKKKTVMKVEPVSETVSSEKLLNGDMLEEIYSRRFYDGVISFYNDIWKQTLERIGTMGTEAILTANGKPVPDLSAHSFSAYNILKKNISDIVSVNASAIAAYDKAKSDHEKAEQQAADTEKVLKKISENIGNEKALFISDLADYEKKYADSVQTIRNIKNEAMQVIKEAKSDKASLFAELKTAEDSLARIRSDRDLLKEIGALRSSDTEIAHIILEKCKEECHDLEEAEERYNNVPFYNFGKRSRARADLDNAKKTLSRLADSITDEYTAERSTACDTLRKKISELDADITEANKKLAASEEDKATERKLANIRKCKDLFDLESLPDIEKKMKPFELEDCPDSYRVYVTLFSDLRENERLLHTAKRRCEESKEEIEKIEGSINSSEAIETLKKSMDLVERLSFTSLYSELENVLKTVYAKYGQKKRKGVFYRHELLYKLLLCSLYYEYRTDIPYFINIDEAQDLAETEYVLLRTILGPKTVFNLYGDVNQLVYAYKGITQWDDIANEITPNIYFLNENYRNTLQITDFCNKKFEAEVLGIGLNGEEVKKLAFEDAITELLKIKGETPDCRAAIIYRKGLYKVSRELAKYERMVAFDIVDPKKISVITVEESKGLEFDAVVVVDSHMSMNEQYIAYTRALDNLIITELPDSEIRFEDDTEIAAVDLLANVSESEVVPEKTEDTSDLQINEREEADDPRAELTKEAVNIRLSFATPYVNSFFASDSDSKILFEALVDRIKDITPDVMVRASVGYIGLARQNEMCRVYVASENDKPFIKFKHLYAKEEFKSERLDHFVKAYKQCCEYIEKYPDSIKIKKYDR